MKKPAEAGLLFWVTRHSCPGDYAARANTSSLAAFAVTSLLGLRPSPGVLPSLLSHPVESCHPHQKHTSSCSTVLFAKSRTVCKYVSGGPGGSRTHVQNAFTPKELQQFFNASLDTNDRPMLQVQSPTAQMSNYQVNLQDSVSSFGLNKYSCHNA